MIRQIDLNDTHDTLELLSLQQLAYRIEAELIGFTEIPPLFDSPQTLKESEESFFGYYDELDVPEGKGRLVGAVSCKQGVRELTICRMMTHPDYFRRGIATGLLRHAEQFAPSGTCIKVSTGTNNTPAVELYGKHGYEPVRVRLVAPGITLTQFQKIV
ncbi:hypothetical protein PAESOLCIP111_06490 [Paenibacillus solanacearum]|uniref:N-acetyltransferase domain-containing protein n=1 Tax=Paenibacillus solanacearum TaxID=2048548 RepID=A0A916K8D8_9BACL|nr:GNAT family N-acetyltransferase [Paenibacillus solanacearum]CAG7652255.1 hypothetical protein PAESOLCIP111_06490 [Paenibacillus solanacearum]